MLSVFAYTTAGLKAGFLVVSTLPLALADVAVYNPAGLQLSAARGTGAGQVNTIGDLQRRLAALKIPEYDPADTLFGGSMKHECVQLTQTRPRQFAYDAPSEGPLPIEDDDSQFQMLLEPNCVNPPPPGPPGAGPLARTTFEGSKAYDEAAAEEDRELEAILADLENPLRVGLAREKRENRERNIQRRLRERAE